MYRLLLKPKFIVYYCRDVNFHISSVYRKKSHYDTLEITPKATKSQVKKAYYRLSMEHHPDQNKSQSASVKFREISEAYEILSDTEKRKMYDRTKHSLDSSNTRAEQFRGEGRHTSGRGPPSGRSKVYNYDEWTRNHYETNYDRAPPSGRPNMYDFDQWTRDNYRANFKKKRYAKFYREAYSDESRNQSQARRYHQNEKVNKIAFIMLVTIAILANIDLVLNEDTIRKIHNNNERLVEDGKS